MQTPKISVLMPVYNADAYVWEAIDSILKQSFTDFEFIIINDCSNDNTLNIINSFNDKRINILSNKTNYGITKSLNIGLTHCKGEYIVRMDADDIAFPNRLQIQNDFMDSNPNIIACGSHLITLGERIQTWKSLKDNDDIKAQLLFNSPMYHPTVILRKDAMMKHSIFYNENFTYAQDYDLWFKLSKIGKIVNIDSNLLQYRIHQNQTNKDMQLLNANKIRANILNDTLNINCKDIPSAYFMLFTPKSNWKFCDYKNLMLFLQLIKTKNQALKYCSPHALEKIILLNLKKSRKIGFWKRNCHRLILSTSYRLSSIFFKYYC